MHRLPLTIAAAALAFSALPAFADDYAGGAIMSTEAGGKEILTDAKGMTLYTYDKDEKGVSNCYDKCATNWPPLLAADGAEATGDFSLVQRNDGSMQWAKDGMPLYLWIKDTQPGEVTGDGVGDVWHVATE